jgi:serine protease Do
VASLEKTVPYLGIEWQMQAGTDSLGQTCEVLTVRRVITESPACKAGMREGDIIRSVDGTPLTADSTLTDLIMAKRPGALVYLELSRASKRVHVRVTLGARELPVFKFKPIERPVIRKESVDVTG